MLLRSVFFNIFECGLLPQRQNGSFFPFRIPLADPLFISLWLAYHRSVSDSDVLLHSTPTALKFNGWNLKSPNLNWKLHLPNPHFWGCHVNFPGCKCCFNLQPVILGEQPAYVHEPLSGSHLKLEFFVILFSLPTKKGHIDIGLRHEKTKYIFVTGLFEAQSRIL